MFLRVLTYVAGMLTVIRGDESVLGVAADRPSFIAADTSFYFEPTNNCVFTATGRRDLTDQEVQQANAFIDAYEFSVVVPEPVVEETFPCVNSLGAYIGKVVPSETAIKVDSEPADAHLWYWDFATSAWVEGYSFDQNGVLSKGVNLNAVGYINGALVDTDLCIMCQTWDSATSKVVYNIDTIKSKKTDKVYTSMVDAVLAYTGNYGKVGAYEIPSYPFQVQEAEAFAKDASTPTPFIDALFLSSNIPGETKEILVSKILTKSAEYKEFYGEALGKYRNLMYRISVATTVEELKAISW